MSKTVGDFSNNPYDLISKIELDSSHAFDDLMVRYLFLINKSLNNDWKESNDD